METRDAGDAVVQMARPRTREVDAGNRAPITLILLLSLAFPLAASAIDHFDAYRYKLAINKHKQLCAYMQRVYSQVFRQPWDYRDRSLSDAFPRLSYVVPDPLVERDMLYSQHPSTPEFERIPWREGRAYFGDDLKNLGPVLIAEFDIDNDGRGDLVIKHGFMKSPCPGGGSCPGGEDHIAVLRPGTIDTGGPLNRTAIIRQYVGEAATGSVLSYDTLRYTANDAPPVRGAGERMSARNIRPFVFEGKTYLSVYDAWAVEYPKRRREWMWVIEYRGGGVKNPVTGDWEPAQTQNLCRFDMVLTKKEQLDEEDARALLFQSRKSRLSLRDRSLLTRAVLTTSPGWNALVEEKGAHGPIGSKELDLNGDGVLEILVQVPSSRGAQPTDSLFYLYVRRGSAYVLDFVLPGSSVVPLPSRTNGFQDLSLRRDNRCHILKRTQDKYAVESESVC